MRRTMSTGNVGVRDRTHSKIVTMPSCLCLRVRAASAWAQAACAAAARASLRERLSDSWRAPALESVLCIHPASERTLMHVRARTHARNQATTALARCAFDVRFGLCALGGVCAFGVRCSVLCVVCCVLCAVCSVLCAVLCCVYVCCCDVSAVCCVRVCSCVLCVCVRFLLLVQHRSQGRCASGRPSAAVESNRSFEDD